VVTVLEECTNEEHRSVVRFFGQKDSMIRIIMKICFLFTLENLCRVKRLYFGGEEFETEVPKWLRQQSKDFYAAGFDELVKQWYKCISAVGGNFEK
jgi:hypothetical protein